MAKAKKSKFFIVVLVLLVAVVAVMVPVLINNKRNNTATTVVACSVNPSVQFVINQNNKVMNVVATNSDGENIELYANFEGLTIEEAAKLFVEICTKANYIDASNNIVANGKKVTFTFSGNLEDYTALQQSVVNSVNNYFDENGIIAGAVANFEQDLSVAIQNINANAKDLTDKTQQQLLEEYVKISNDIKDIALEKRDDFKTSYENLYSILSSKETISSALFSAYEVTLSSVNNMIALLPNGEQIQEALEPVFNIVTSKTIDELKTNLNAAKTAVLNTNLGNTIENTLNEMLNSVQTMLDNLQKAYEEAKAKFEDDYAKLVTNLKDTSKTIQENIKTAFETRVNEYKDLLETRKDYFEQNKQEIQTKIEEFRNSLTA